MKKLTLNKIEVQSYTTSLNEEEAKTINGGFNEKKFKDEFDILRRWRTRHIGCIDKFNRFGETKDTALSFDWKLRRIRAEAITKK